MQEWGGSGAPDGARSRDLFLSSQRPRLHQTGEQRRKHVCPRFRVSQRIFISNFPNSIYLTHCFKFHSIEGEYVPRVGDQVSYRLVMIPPKCEKKQAVHVHITNFTPEVHQRWSAPLTDEEGKEGSRPNSPNKFNSNWGLSPITEVISTSRSFLHLVITIQLSRVHLSRSI